MPQPLHAMTEDQLLDHATRCATTARQADLDLLRTAYQWAVLNSPDRLDPANASKPGREKAKRYGGAGTAPVSEFAAATLGARIGISPYAAARLIGDAQDLCHRHPELWSRVQALEVRASYARHVTQKTRDLTVDEAGYVDHAVAESADGRICWTRFEALVEGAVATAAPQIARAKEETARKARFAKRLRGTDPDKRHGMASFLIRADIATITQIDAVITAVAAALKTALPDLSTDERRLRALMLLLAHQVPADSPARDAQPDIADWAADTPSWAVDDQPADQPEPQPADVTAAGADLAGIDLTALLPTVYLYVHLYGGTTTTGATGPQAEHDRDGAVQEPIARVEGHGPVTLTWLRTILGQTCRFKITPVLDLDGQAPVDAYEIPDRHRQAVHLMTPADVFPYAGNLGRTKQIDHTIPWTPPDADGLRGQSRIGNYGPMTTSHHRIKTHGHWQIQQPFPGIYLWRDPAGRFHLVDHTGTRPLPGAPTKPITLELYRNSIELDYAPAA